MGFNIFRWITGSKGKTESKEITVTELCEAGAEYAARIMAFEVCVNMVATALGRCEFRTFRENKEIFEREYYLWNISPNANQNSTDFIHKLISKLYRSNEALVVELSPHDGVASLVVADEFSLSRNNPSRPNEYCDVRIGDTTLQKVYRERNVLHFRLNEQNIKPVIDAMTESYSRLISAAERYYRRTHGSQWKVHVDQIQSGQENWRDDFTKMISQQMKPFLNGDNAVLPEFDGYNYSDVTRQVSVDSTDCRNLCEEIFNQTARGFMIPIVLSGGKVEATGDANNRFLTYCIDPICDQLQEEITRKRYGYDEWARGNFIRVDSSSILHFDMFANAANVEKLIGSGAFTINDVLRAAGQPPIGESWANERYLTLNIEKLDADSRRISREKGGMQE